TVHDSDDGRFAWLNCHSAEYTVVSQDSWGSSFIRDWRLRKHRFTRRGSRSALANPSSDDLKRVHPQDAIVAQSPMLLSVATNPSQLWRRFSLRAELLEKIASFVRAHQINKSVAGIHLRMTDTWCTHPTFKVKTLMQIRQNRAQRYLV